MIFVCDYCSHEIVGEIPVEFNDGRLMVCQDCADLLDYAVHELDYELGE